MGPTNKKRLLLLCGASALALQVAAAPFDFDGDGPGPMIRRRTPRNSPASPRAP